MRSKMLLSAIFALALLLCAAFFQLCFLAHAALRWKSACPLAWDRAISSRFWSAKRSMRS